MDISNNLVTFSDTLYLDKIFHNNEIIFGSLSNIQCDALYLNKAKEIGSGALLPLIRHGELLGSINLFSFDKERFKDRHATDFLDHLSKIASICLENIVLYHKAQFNSITDALTGTRNRRHFDEVLSHKISEVLIGKSNFSIALIDIDRFKKVNDTYGHDSGDRVLRELVKALIIDLPENYLFFRYGGEEFILIIPSDTEHAFKYCEKLRKSVSNLSIPLKDGLCINISISIGLYSTYSIDRNIPKNDMEQMLINGADKALYIAKNNGRNRVVKYDDSCI